MSGSKDTKFQKGTSGNPGGKPVGSRNRVTKAFLTALAEDFERYGRVAIARCRRKHPDAYVRMLASLVPKELDVTHVHGYDERLLALLQGEAQNELQQLDGGGTDRADGEGVEPTTH